MATIIVYGSRYGATKRYADMLSEKTGIKAVPYENVTELTKFDTVLYLGSLYAGSVTGLSKTVKSLSAAQSVILITVGLSNPDDNMNAQHIKASVRRQISGWLSERVTIFHLRGGIDYRKLCLRHRIMMWLFYRMVKKIPAERRTEEEKAIVETYGQCVDFVDFDSLDRIIQTVL